MTFAHPDWLWLMAAIPLLLLLEWRARARTEKLLILLTGTRREPVLLEQRLPGRRRLGILLRSLALVLLALGAAGPEWGYELVRRGALGSEVVLAIDVSASMDVRDVPPSRLEEARREALATLDHLGGSKVGVVAFAGDAVRLCPLTLDRSAARLVIESLSSTTVSEPGTDLGRGLRAAAKLLPPRSRADQAIVLWTDGEDLEQGARAALDEVARTGIRVFAIGVGTPAGDVVPVLDDQGRVVDVKREENGGPHRSRLDERLLQALARRTRGAYFTAARPGGELPRLLASLTPLARGRRGGPSNERLVERPVARFPWVAAGAATLLALDRVRRRRRTPPEAEKPLPLARAAVLALGLLLLASAVEAQSDWARGDDALRAGRWAAAESLYARRLRAGAPPAVRVNLALARAKAGKIAEAKAELQRALSARGPAGQTAAYNLGTLHAEQRAYDDALRELRRALERDPADDDARFNYEWVLREQQRQRERERPQQPQRSGGDPQPSQPPPGGQQDPRAGAPLQPPPAENAPPPPEMGKGMDRRQAEQLLGSLQELERLEQRRLRQVRVMRERRGRDW